MNKLTIKNISIIAIMIFLIIFSAQYISTKNKLKENKLILQEKLHQLKIIQNNIATIEQASIEFQNMVLKSIITQNANTLMLSSVELKKIHIALNFLQKHKYLSNLKKNFQLTKAILLNKQAKILQLSSFLVEKRGSAKNYIDEIDNSHNEFMSDIDILEDEIQKSILYEIKEIVNNLDQMEKYLTLFSILTLLLFLLAIFLIYKLILNPIFRITEFTKYLSKPDTKRRLNINGKHEIAILATSIDNQLDISNINYAKLLELQNSLEQQIEDRTQKQNQLLSLFDKGNVCLFKWKNDKHWSVEHVSSNVENLYGYSAEEFLNKKVLYNDLINKDDLQLIGAEVEEAITEGVEFFTHKPYKITTKDNQIKWLLDNTLIIKDSRGDITHFLGYILDITELKDKEKELQKQKEIFEAIFNGSKDAIAILDMKSNFLEVNPAYTELTGFTKDELLATSCLNLTPAKDIEPSKLAMQEVMKDGYIKNFEKDCEIKDNKYITINMSMSMLHNPERILISVRDITRSKELEHNILEAKIKAEESTKFKSEFLANMSHEIRTPMNGIIGMSHLALQTNLNNKQKEYLKIIDTSAKSLLGIINDILDFSKIEAGKLSIEKITFNLQETIESVINIIKFKVKKKNLELKISYGDEVGEYFNGDSLRISQVLTNLIGNAIKFTDSGEIFVNIDKISQGKYRFEVKDSGIGLSDEEQEFLFNPFSQADGSTTRKYGGTGLGLSISMQLVELMGGKIWCESKKNVGSSFIFEIDLEEIYDEDKNILSEEINENDLEEQMHRLKGSNILLVEDNKTNQLVTLGLLEDSEIIIDIANNGQEAVKKFSKNNYELILMDIQMPIMDGYEATKLIREINKEIPIIALSANAMKEDFEKSKESGMNEHLNKPIDISRLYTILLKYISKKV